MWMLFKIRSFQLRTKVEGTRHYIGTRESGYLQALSQEALLFTMFLGAYGILLGARLVASGGPMPGSQRRLVSCPDVQLA